MSRDFYTISYWLVFQVWNNEFRSIRKMFHTSQFKMYHYHVIFQSFTLLYEAGKDTDLAYHYDNAEITFNFCLGTQFSGAEVYFTHLTGVRVVTLGLWVKLVLLRVLTLGLWVLLVLHIAGFSFFGYIRICYCAFV